QGIPYADCPPAFIEPTILDLVSPAAAIRCCALPLEIKGRKLIVAMAEPQNLALLDELRFTVGMPIAPRFSFREDIIQGMDKFDGEPEPDEPEQEIAPEVSLSRDDDSFGSDIEFISEELDDENSEIQRELHAGMRQRTPAVRFLAKIMGSAVERGASDI